MLGGFTSPYSADGWYGILNVPEGHTILRTFVETALYTRTAMEDPLSTPFDPTWFADNGQFNLALNYYEGGGLPGSPVLPDDFEGGGGEFLWRARMKPYQDGYWTTPDGPAQVVRWEPERGTQMQSEGKRGPVSDLGTYLYWTWKVIDIHGYFALDAANMFSYMAGDLHLHMLTSTLS